MKSKFQWPDLLPAALAAIVLFSPLSGRAQPVPVTSLATSLFNNTATLNGTVNPNGEDTTAWFEWGTSLSYGNLTTPGSVGSGTNVVAVNVPLTGLTPGVTYHYRCVASNSLGVVRGADQSFWTPVITLNGTNPLTNECHMPFVDPGAFANGPPLAIAAGYNHNLVLKADGTVVGWGYNADGQTTIPTSATNVTAIAADSGHSLALKADGSVVGWGRNNDGQINIPASATNVVAIAAGWTHSLALKADTSIVAWGNPFYGLTNVPTNATNVVAIAAGGEHSLAIKADGSVVGWGRNDFGQTTIPASATNVVAIAAGDYHSLALNADGTIVCWGANFVGQTSIPASATNVIAIAAGAWHSLALKTDGTIVGWGSNGSVQTTIPASATNVVAIAVGFDHNLALKADGTIVGWGSNGSGQTNIPTGLTNLNLSLTVTGTVDVDTPGTYQLSYGVTNSLGAVATASRTVVVWIMARVSTLPASNLHNDTATLNGKVNPKGLAATAWFEWGTSQAYGNTMPLQSIGNGTNEVTINAGLNGLTPGVIYHYRCMASNSGWVTSGVDLTFWTPAITLNGPNSLTNECHVPFINPGASVSGVPLTVAAGVSHSLALKADGTVVGWGDNNYGQTNVPASATNVVAIAAGYYHSLALKTDGTVVGWGRNDYGQATIPASATNVMAIASGQYHSLALKADGSVIGWGRNYEGQTTIPVSATNAMAIAAGGYHSLALKADGTVVCWGRNDGGQTTIPASATNVMAIAAGSYHSLALRADRMVVAWGLGNYPIPASATNVVAIAAGGVANAGPSLALRADGTVVGWGQNGFGKTTIPASATNVVAVAVGGYHSLAIKADGTIVAWGDNSYGLTNVPASLYQLNLVLSVNGTVDVNTPGTYLISYRTTNVLGAVATAARTVIVTDTLPPVLALLGGNPLMHVIGTPFVDPGATATDLCAGDRTGNIIVWGTVNTNVAGSNSLVYIVSDTIGNVAVTDRIVVMVTRPVLTGLAQLGNGSFSFSFTNTPGAQFNVRATTNVALPFSAWTLLGPVLESPSGVFQFTDFTATNHPTRFYRVE